MEIFKPRDYQIPSIKAAMGVLQDDKEKSIIVLPTGAGKSWVIAEAAKELVDKKHPVVILQPSQELLKQNFTKFVNCGGNATVCCASLKTFTKDKVPYTSIKVLGEDIDIPCDEVSEVTYATVQTAIKHIDKFRELGVKHIIVDEVHLQSKAGSVMRNFIKELKATHVLGLTATPIYMQGGMYGSRLVMINRSQATMFRRIAHVCQIKELVENGWWTKLKYKVIATDTNDLRFNTSGSDFTIESQKEYYKSNNLRDQIKEEVKKQRKKGRKRILVFVPDIAEAEALSQIIKGSRVVHSKLSKEERDEVVDGFNDGLIDVVVNVNILATGYDNPLIDAIITARPTGSIAIYYQQIGRGVRIHPEKKNCRITDFSGNVLRFGRVEELTFEEIEHYGWGMFGKGGILLSDYPMSAETRPNKESLIKAEIEQQRKEKEKMKEADNPEFRFGKFKGRKFVSIIQSKDKEQFEQWLAWIIDQDKKKKWEWYGAYGMNLKRVIYAYMKLGV